jgi:type IV pilus assembly protein PilM
MFNPIDYIFRKRITSVLGVDIGTSSIKIAELKREDGNYFRLVNYAVMEMKKTKDESGFRGLSFDLQDSELADRIKVLKKEAGFATDSAIMSLPVFSTFVTIMEMPVIDEKELATAVPLQAREYIPIPISEVVLDWKLVKKTTKADLVRADLAKRVAKEADQNEAAVPGSSDQAAAMGGEDVQKRRTAKSEVLLMAAPREMVQKFVRIAQLSGLTLLGLEIESFALARSAVADPNIPVLLLDIGAFSSSVAVFDDGFLRLVHTIGVSSSDLRRACARALGTDNDRAELYKNSYGLYASGGEKEIVAAYLPLLESLSRDIERVISAYWRTNNRQVAQVILSGGAALLKGLDEYLVSRLRIPVNPINPFKKTMIPKDLTPVAGLLANEFANAIGLAMKEI